MADRPAGVCSLTCLWCSCMMFLETWLVYPVPPVERGDWHPAGSITRTCGSSRPTARSCTAGSCRIPIPSGRSSTATATASTSATTPSWSAHLRDALAGIRLHLRLPRLRPQRRPARRGRLHRRRPRRPALAGRARWAFKPNDIVLMGRSLGSARGGGTGRRDGCPAAGARKRVSDDARRRRAPLPWLPVRWVMENRYDSLARIQHYHGPLFQSHGTADEIDPDRAWPTTVRRRPEQRTSGSWSSPACGHNDGRPRQLLRRTGRRS